MAQAVAFSTGVFIPSLPTGAAIPGSGTTPVRELTPSDVVLLVGLPRPDGRARNTVGVPETALLKAAIASAMLANAEAGTLTLEPVVQKVWFGLSTRTMLWTVAACNLDPWPDGSLESRLMSGFCFPRGIRVSDAIYSWLRVTSADPWTRAGKEILESMVGRGLLNVAVVQTTFLKLFTITSKRYLLPQESAAALAVRQPSEPARPLLEECQRTRPDVLALLMAEIERGFDRRTNRG